MTTPRIEEMVEEVASVCDEVEFLHGVPVKLPSQTKALLRGKVRDALTQVRQAGDKDGYERGRKAGRDEAVGILKQIEYDVDVDKKPTIAEEAWANQYESKAEAFWYGECEGLKVFKEAIECIKALQDNK